MFYRFTMCACICVCVFFFFFFSLSPPTELSLTTHIWVRECHNCENAVPMEIQQLSQLVLFGNSYCCWLCFSLPTIILVFSSHFSFFKPKNFVKISVGKFCFLFQNLIIWLSFWKKIQSLQDYQNWKRNPSCGRVKKIKLLLRSARRK